MTNLFAANIFGHDETLSELPSKSFKNTGKKHVESHLTCHELHLVHKKFCFDHKVLMHSLFNQCLNVALSQISNVFRSVTRWDGARGKKQVWRPHVRTWGLSEANVL